LNLNPIIKNHIKFLRSKGINFSNYQEKPSIEPHYLNHIQVHVMEEILKWKALGGFPGYTDKTDKALLEKISMDHLPFIEEIVRKTLETLPRFMAYIEADAKNYTDISVQRCFSFSLSSLIDFSKVYPTYQTLLANLEIRKSSISNGICTPIIESILEKLTQDGFLCSHHSIKPLRNYYDKIAFF
jgi:hypothetical protein